MRDRFVGQREEKGCSVVHANNIKRFFIDYEIDEVDDQNEDLESFESDVDELVAELPNPVQRLKDQENNDGEAVVPERYNL